jgi:hypothetical protein
VEKEKQEPDKKIITLSDIPRSKTAISLTDILILPALLRFFSSTSPQNNSRQATHLLSFFGSARIPSDRSQSQSYKISKAVEVRFPSHKILPLSDYFSSSSPLNKVQKALALPNFIQQSTSHDS